MTLYDNMGRWVEKVSEYPPHNVEREKQESIVLKIRRQAAKPKYSIKEGEECQVCGEDILEVLRKHHLVLIAAYPLCKDLNEHIVTLCENCHDIAHRLIYNERGGISWKSVQKLKDRGYWEKFVELDKQAAEALEIVHKRGNMR
jgi:predicted HNH restriction endonuclease